MLEYRSGSVLGYPSSNEESVFPFFYNKDGSRIFEQISYASQLILTGYYQWRDGRMRYITFKDGYELRVDPSLNPGTVAVIFLMAHYYTYNEWVIMETNGDGVIATYRKMFGDPWQYIPKEYELITPTTQQPFLQFPFDVMSSWSFTGGPHLTWGVGSPWGALDFAPGSNFSGCGGSDQNVRSASNGIIARYKDGIVVVDMDGDGNEQTGWVLFYFHVDANYEIRTGKRVETFKELGRPSCLGGHSTGDHVHLARKYNGEWLDAVNPIPFEFDGWTVRSTGTLYEGYLEKGYFKILASDKSVRVSQVDVAIKSMMIFNDYLQVSNILLQNKKSP